MRGAAYKDGESHGLLTVVGSGSKQLSVIDHGIERGTLSSPSTVLNLLIGQVTITTKQLMNRALIY